MRGDNLAVGPNVPIMRGNNVVIPTRIWKLFLAGTYTWMIMSCVYMCLAILGAVYYALQNDKNAQILISVNYAFSILSIYWLSANVRDLYRYNVLRSDPELRSLVTNSLVAPSDCIRKVRVTLSALGMIVALIIFIVSMLQTTADKITGCIIELQIVSATAVLTKTFQDKQDSIFLGSFNSQPAGDA